MNHPRYVQRRALDGSNTQVNDMGDGYVHLSVSESPGGHCDISLSVETWQALIIDLNWTLEQL